MTEIFAKTLYSLVLVGVVGFCIHEVWQVWFDRTLQYGKFAATKDGQDAAAVADSFRRLILQQQNILYGLYKAPAPHLGEFRIVDVLRIDLADLGRLPSSDLDQLKIEAAGVNVTSILTTLRRWITSPNEITGSVDQLGSNIYISAVWPYAPRADENGTEQRTYSLPVQNDLNLASFDLACRIFLTRGAPYSAVLKSAQEDDFCIFSRAFAAFRSYVALRDRAASDSELKDAATKFEAARHSIESLVAAKSSFPYVYKLAAYLALEDSAATGRAADPPAIKTRLDQAQAWLNEYRRRLVVADPKVTVPDAEERLAYLTARAGALSGGQPISQPIASVPPPEPAAPHAEKMAPLRPGASIGDAKTNTAGTLCCFVKDQRGQKYLVTASYVIGAGPIVSPAVIDSAPTRLQLGSANFVEDGVAFVSVPNDVAADNGGIAGIAEPGAPLLGEHVTLLGRTSGTSSGIVRAVNVNEMNIDSGGGRKLQFKNLIATDRISLPGDAGAPVLDGQNKLIGLLIAGSAEVSLVLPLAPILKQHNLTLL